MDSSERSNFKRVKADALAKASELIQLSHVSADVVENTKDLMNIIEQLDKAEAELINGGADMRILRKRYDALKTEHKATSLALEKIKLSISGEIPPILRELLSQLATVEKSAETLVDANFKEATAKFRPLVKRLIEILTKI